MPERFPPLEPVRTRAGFARHEGAQHSSDNQAVSFLSDHEAAFASVVRGMWHAHSSRSVAELILDHGVRMFRERTASMLDDLAELWWKSEHVGSRVRPFSSLPIGERAELRARVKRLLLDRVPDALGDQAVLEGETKRLLEIPASALRRADADLERKVERGGREWLGAGGSAMHAIFAARQVSIAHVGDCRAVRMRRGILDQLTREHTLQRDQEEANLPVPHDIPFVITRVVGDLRGKGVDAVTATLEKGDIFLFMTLGTYEHFAPADLRAALLANGVEAAPLLIDRARPTAEQNIAAVAVEIL